MNSIKVNILGKSYPLRVQEGEEQLMREIAAFVDDRFRLFKRELATQTEQTIMILASLSIAEELFIQRREQKKSVPAASGVPEEVLSDISVRIEQLLDDIKSGNLHI